MTKTPYPYQKYDPSGGSVSASPSPQGDEVDDLDRIEFQLREISAATVEYGPDGIPCGYGPPAHSAEEMADKAITCLALLDRHRAAISALPRRETEGPDYKAMFEAVEKRLQECDKNIREWRLITVNQSIRNRRVAKWLSAALEDPSTCEEMKADIRAWFATNQEPTHE